VRRAFAVFGLFLAACGGGAKSTGGAAPPSKESTMEVPGDGDKKKKLTVEDSQASFNDAESALAAAGNDCALLCKALSSMSSATDRLCELAKENGDSKRCDDAKTKLDAAKAKVKSTCGGCS
jgi:hypothetical protein